MNRFQTELKFVVNQRLRPDKAAKDVRRET
jgi:hypothetical protein